MKISYGILVHNETDSLRKLLKSIHNVKKEYEYEIVIIYDKPSISKQYNSNNFSWLPTTETEKILKDFMLKPNTVLEFNPLNNDFAAQKNYMTEMCSGDWIINPDADELFPEYLLENAHLIIEQNDTECIWVPRVNIVEGLTPEMAPQFGFRLNERGWINWPDYQARIYKNDYPRIHWEYPVHERVVGYKTHSLLPTNDLDMAEHLAIKHPKTLDRQIEQNKKYAKIMR